jgi:hypothetical protein
MWAPRTFRARVNHYGAMRAALKALHDLARGAAVCTENSSRADVGFKLIWKATMATWIKCTNTRHEDPIWSERKAGAAEQGKMP